MANKKPPARRTGLWAGVAVVVVIILVVVVAAAVLSSKGGGTSTTSTSSTSTAAVTSTTTSVTCTGSSTSQTITMISGPVLVGASGDVSIGVTCANGQLGTLLSYAYGQPINIAVTVPSSLTPTSIGTVFDGNPQNTNPWNVTSTGRTYVLGYGAAGRALSRSTARTTSTRW